MKAKLLMLMAGIALAIASLGMSGPATSAVAQEPVTPEADGAYFYGADAGMPRWLRHSIVVCAAETMDIEVEQVLLGLRNGHSLKEIGIRVGVRPAQLEQGILRCERNLLARLVDAGELEPREARRIFQFLSEHITRIINYSWDPAA